MLLCSFPVERSKVEGSSGVVSCWRLRPSTASNSKREVLLLSVEDPRLSKESKEPAPLLLCLRTFEGRRIVGRCQLLAPSAFDCFELETRGPPPLSRPEAFEGVEGACSFAPLPRTFESRRIVGRTPHEDPPSHMFESFDEEGATCRPRGRDRDCVHRGHSCANAKQFARHPSCIVMEAC